MIKINLNMEIGTEDLKELIKEDKISSMIQEKIVSEISSEVKENQVYNNIDLCTHTIGLNNDSNVCSICNKTVKFIDEDKIDNIIDNMDAVIENIKVMNFDLSNNKVKELAVLQYKINEIGNLYKSSVSEFNRLSKLDFDKVNKYTSDYDKLPTVDRDKLFGNL